MDSLVILSKIHEKKHFLLILSLNHNSIKMPERARSNKPYKVLLNANMGASHTHCKVSNILH
jgi:hypothetical protein